MDRRRNFSRNSYKTLDFSTIRQYNTIMFSINSIEDCLETLVFSKEFDIQRSDYNLMTSLARQVKRGIGLTDRQYSLAKTKLVEYKKQFNEKSVDIDSYLDTLRIPLREIDRSHWLKQEDDKLKIRFPFTKKIIDRIEELRRLDLTAHSYENHTHTFPFKDNYLYKLVQIANRFDTKFEIQSELVQRYNLLQEYQENKNNYLPGVYDNEVKNLPDSAVNYLEQDCGEVANNLALYYDRRYLYGLHSFDLDAVEKSLFEKTALTSRIIKRNKSNVFIDNTKYNIHSLVQAIDELKRYPMLVVLGNNCNETLPLFFEAINGIIPSTDHSVLFRLDNKQEESREFNLYIRDKKLNNSVAKNTKVVYISMNKVPKPLLESDFRAKMCLTFTPFTPSNKSKAYVENLDLLLHYYEGQSMIDKYYRKNIENV